MPRYARHVADELGSAARTITTERRRFLSQDGKRALRNCGFLADDASLQPTDHVTAIGAAPS
jgi:hypothetical protein